MFSKLITDKEHNGGQLLQWFVLLVQAFALLGLLQPKWRVVLVDMDDVVAVLVAVILYCRV